jgi:hypothetical protein
MGHPKTGAAAGVGYSTGGTIVDKRQMNAELLDAQGMISLGLMFKRLLIMTPAGT